MPAADLRPCPACARHVRASAPRCPFCGERLAAAFRAGVRAQPPSVWLARAARFALGTGALSLTPACSDTPMYGCSVCLGNEDAAGSISIVDATADSKSLGLVEASPVTPDFDGPHPCSGSVAGLDGMTPMAMMPCESDAAAPTDATAGASDELSP
jgi:hypothetical protein